ncbi:MAG: Ig-like domain-containing protein, partial [Candidatus Binataceae bacterium]
MNERNRLASGVRAVSFGAILTCILLVNGMAAAQTVPVQIISPANNAQVSGIVNFTAIQGQGVSWINFYVDNQYFASSPSDSKEWNTANVAPGTHVLSVRAYAQPHILVGSAQVSVLVGSTSSTPTPTPTATPTAIATVAPT